MIHHFTTESNIVLFFSHKIKQLKKFIITVFDYLPLQFYLISEYSSACIVTDKSS